ncbi:MAG: pentapeptide repeat-containing protein [Cyanobacteriota bacterium]|nr:pentapeptide repeat-containing protein [Cyanobacteriota bacterium]
MAGKVFRNIWRVLNTDIEPSLSGTVAGGVEAAKAVFELADTLQKNKSVEELKPIIDNIDSVLDVLNSPLGQITQKALPFLPIATSILQYIVKQTSKEPTLADSVQLVGQVAYMESLSEFLRDYPEIELQQIDASDEVKNKIKKLGEGIEFEDRHARETLLCFHDSPLAKAFNEILQGRLEESGLGVEVAATVTERVSRGTHRYMKEAVAKVKDSAKELAGIYGDGWQRDLEAYASIDKYLNDVIAAQPEQQVFDEEFVFRQVYVRLEVKPVDSNGNIPRSAEPENIEEWAKRILLDEKKLDRVLFVQAGPGRGKSVFCRMFGELVRRELHPIYTPILIRLRDVTAFEMDIDKTLSAAVARDFVTNDSGWLTDRNTRFLFLLDGFDELLLERGTGEDLKLFLKQVAQFQERAAENSERGHRVLITGRPLALYGIERLMPQNLERSSIAPMADDIQNRWLAKWLAVVDANPTEAAAKTEKFKEFLRGDTCPAQVNELAREPLLLYLLAAMHRDGQLKMEMFADAGSGLGKVLVYEQALEWVLEKQRARGGENLNEQVAPIDDLRSLLAETGLCVVQSGREYAAISTIESRLRENEDEGAIASIEKARQSGSEDALPKMLATFYLKSAAGKENSVEFFHKSFGEFLCAERMAETMEEWTSTSGRRRKTFAVGTKELEWQVYDLFGYGALTAEVVEYLMALLVKNEVDLVVLFDRLQDFYLSWCDGDFIEHWERSEEEVILPLKKAKQLQKRQKVDRGQRQVDIYTGLNAMILLFELHRYGQSREELKDKIAFHPCGEPEDEKFDRTRLLRIIGYSQCQGAGTFWQIVGKFLSGADLRGANLRGANLSGANLSGADLSGANLSGAHLIRTNLRGADLSSANLSGANLSGANLSGANLSGADLRRADLRDADLRRANLRDANLKGADLSGANLSGANLSGANLNAANLSGANLSGVDLISADLSGAYLSGAYLSGACLSDLKWNNQTAWSHAIGLHEATQAPEALKQHPEFAATVVLSRGYSQVTEREVEEAIASYQEAQTINPQLEISARFWNHLCWYGCLSDRAAEVLFAGEKAVELEPDGGDYKDTRGLARALTGDIAGAIEDFQAALDSGLFHGDEVRKQKRQRWLETLQAGVNPFTPEELAELRYRYF